MSRVGVVVAVLALNAALPVSAALPASAVPVASSGPAGCRGSRRLRHVCSGAGVVMLSATGPARLVCVGGVHDGEPVGGIV